MDVRIKICGVVEVEDAVVAAAAGADYLGVNFWPGSKRHVSYVRAEDIVAAARGVNDDIAIVGVFVNQSLIEIDYLVDDLELDFVQFHGDEGPDAVAPYGYHAIKAIRVRSADDMAHITEFPCTKILLDGHSSAYGGSGTAFPWSWASAADSMDKQIFLAGGLTPDNVQEAVRTVHPYAVDVASGVERAPGVKDHDAIRRFIDAVRSA